ncbi:hypothetical protein [Pseudomonas sp. dw_358]|uniref:hypothetical protein n=1 Tax=Pseudomonas sp. dw_358 TaxID=2720083 RepID=UPI001BD2DEB0|nr:hypothetical protein [Pseudomonas sp. dw_358]
MYRPLPAEHINRILDRVIAGMGGESGVPVASREEYQQLAGAAASMVGNSFTRTRKEKAAGLCMQYLRLSLCPSVAPDGDVPRNEPEARV